METFVYLLIVIPGALLLDRVFGELQRGHPLVGFGRVAQQLEQRLRASADSPARNLRLRGLAAMLVLILPPVVLVAGFTATALQPFTDILLLYLAVGWKSLDQHAVAVLRELQSGNIVQAQQQLGRIVSRETAGLEADAIAAATVESVLENGNDAVYAALFWFVLAGAPGVTLYRLVNTLDAMWGYRNARYRDFGRACAGLDDLLNFLPARLTALSYTLCGNIHNALICWWQQGRHWKSPNAGPVMAAGAGALSIEIGGPARYHGALHTRPVLGRGPAATAADIERAIALTRTALGAFLILLITGTLLAR